MKKTTLLDMQNKLIIILLLVLNICFVFKIRNNFKLINKINNNIENNEDNLNYLNNKKIYNNYESTFISIFLDYTKVKHNIEYFINEISIFLNNNCYNNIQINILTNFSNSMLISEISKLSLKNIKIYFFEDDYIKTIFNIINRIETIFLLFINKFIELNNIDIHKIFNITRGSINHIFKYYLNANEYFYLIRFKILRDIIEGDIKFKNFEEIIIYMESYELPKLNYIPVSYTPSNEYTTLAYTSMLSILFTKSFNTYIKFFIVISKEYSKININFLESLYSQFEYFNITFVKIDDKYKNAFTARYLTFHAYFRYSLGELIPNLKKIIYLDPDSLCFGDLSQLYNLNFREKAILGRVVKTIKSSGKNYISINTGILLLNLEKMRKIKLEQKILNILNSGFGHRKINENSEDNVGTDILTLDQAIINLYFYKYIGPLPPRFNALSFNYSQIVFYNNYSGNRYENDYLYFSFKYPIIKHYGGPSKGNLFKREEWIYYSKKSIYFNKISNNLSDIYNYSVQSF